MEVSVINSISDFETGMAINSLHNPSHLSRIFSFPGIIENIPEAYTLWTWSALILALLAAFSTVINRLKLIIIKLRGDNSPASQPLLSCLDDDDYSDDDEASSHSSDDDEDDSPSLLHNSQPVDEDFHVAGAIHYFDDQWQNRKFKLRRRRNGGEKSLWSEFASGKSVVKLWDGLGLGLDLNKSSDNVFCIYDTDKDKATTSFFDGTRQIPAISTSSPALVLSADVGSSGALGLKLWDRRLGRRAPAVSAEWRRRSGGGRVLGIDAGGVEKVYVRGDVSGDLTVGDMRNVNSPLENVTESDGDTWWDADAVIVSDDVYEDESGLIGCDSVVSRCRDAVRAYLF